MSEIWIPDKRIIIIEETIKAVGKVEIYVDKNLVFDDHNNTLAGSGYCWANGLRYGTCSMINGMYAHQQGGAGRTTLSTPVCTAGGAGATDFLTVQSTWTNNTGAGVTYDYFWLTAEPYNIQDPYLDICEVGNDSILVPNLATMTINWTVSIPATSCQYQAAQRNQLAKGINVTAGVGGTMHSLSQGLFNWAAGASPLQATHQFFGGDGFTQELTVDTRYAHAAAMVTVTSYDQYNSNGVLAHSSGAFAVDVDNGETVKALHKVRFLGD